MIGCKNCGQVTPNKRLCQACVVNETIRAGKGDRGAPFKVWEHNIEDLRTWWGPYATLAEAQEALVEVTQHHSKKPLFDGHVRDCYRRRLA